MNTKQNTHGGVKATQSLQMIPPETDLSLNDESICFYSSDFRGLAAYYQPNRSSRHSYSL
jgi:hypothetical protein